MNELFSVRNKTALITGASSGIGRHCALVLAKQGANVILNGRNEQRLREVEKECQQYGAKTLAVVADVQDHDVIKRMVEISRKHFGEVDILINSAGIGMRVPVLELTEEQWNNVLDINLKGTLLVSQAISKWMIEKKTAGKIINISSSAAFRVSLTRAAYGASKAGVEYLTRSFALSLVPHNIRVNAIAPGFFITELTRNYLQGEMGRDELNRVPMKRAADVKEMEGVLLLLASDASSYITGNIMHIDGGFTINSM